MSFYVKGTSGNLIAAENGASVNPAAAQLVIDTCLPDGG